MMKRALILVGLVLVGCSGTRARQADAEGLKHLSAVPQSSSATAYDAGLAALTSGHELELAEEAFATAVRLSPDVATYHYHLGQAYWRDRKRELAMAQLRVAASLNPPAPEAVVFLRRLDANRRDDTTQEIADAVADRLSR